MLDKLLSHVWLKPSSLFIVLLIEAVSCISFYPKTSQESFVPFILSVVVSILLFFVYFGFVYHKNYYIRKAKTLQNGVLFVFHAQDEKTFDDAKFNIIERLKEINSLYSLEIDPVCVNVNKIKDFNFGSKQFMIKLLIKTNCMICIDINYLVDDVNSANDYSIRINTATLHPEFDATKSKFFEAELNRVAEPIRNIKFNKQQKIEKFDITSEYLGFAIEYITGLVALLCCKTVQGLKIFEKLYNVSMQGKGWFKEEIKKCYFTVCEMISIQIIEHYYDTWDENDLDDAEKYILKMNELYPDSYGYNLQNALVRFSKYRDIPSAVSHIKKCKSIASNDNWMYSDAFLTAYSSAELDLVFAKYKKACQTSYNPVKIITFIENVIKDEPDKIMLYFALGYLYVIFIMSLKMNAYQ